MLTSLSTCTRETPAPGPPGCQVRAFPSERGPWDQLGLLPSLPPPPSTLCPISSQTSLARVSRDLRAAKFNRHHLGPTFLRFGPAPETPSHSICFGRRDLTSCYCPPFSPAALLLPGPPPPTLQGECSPHSIVFSFFCSGASPKLTPLTTTHKADSTFQFLPRPVCRA